MAKIIYDHHKQPIFVNKPNVIEPGAPGVAAHHEHPGLPHQLDESTPVLCTHLVSVIMVMGNGDGEDNDEEEGDDDVDGFDDGVVDDDD